VTDVTGCRFGCPLLFKRSSVFSSDPNVPKRDASRTGFRGSFREQSGHSASTNVAAANDPSLTWGSPRLLHCRPIIQMR
jgi:hypothetical protein